MKKFNFPWIAMGVGIVTAIIMLRAGATKPPDQASLPPLTLLFMSEFGFFVTAIGAVVGARKWYRNRDEKNMLVLGVSCGVLAFGFLAIGIAMWRVYTV